ncbi:polysaccharide deacetylase [Hymenobacter qilianensis]|uniref:Polysaccharide deacetylase n=2 Tax=Hymenobacter qilianensis TaxID=1385715 RepID=A0ACB5PRV0_9BACT|nr:polysaccharide deacetylase family protein [Hymenobacter qilianensis]QNP52287.1 polysaccharide deacetylase family protein [Hymenobacter qilianensis]GGF66143.1 polysaccharide deacetylase [Hymenobacter qilianensis]
MLTRPPALLHSLFPGCEWQHPTAERILYLTFDDGPIPEETPWVLDQLADYKASATFFCVGDNVQRYPSIAQRTVAEGHRLANHTHHHLSAWAHSRATYLQDVAQCQQVLTERSLLEAGKRPLLRPPYGRLTWPLLRRLRPQYRLIMWSVLTQDYDQNLPAERCLHQSIAATRPGDIVVFHDSQKARRNLRFVLPRYLAHFAEQGFTFASL